MKDNNSDENSNSNGSHKFPSNQVWNDNESNLLFWIILDSNKNNQSNIKSTIKLLFTTKMLKITGLMLTSGLVSGIVSGFLPKVIANVVNEDVKISKIINWMLVLGIGEIFGSFTTGKIIDIMGDRFTIFFIMWEIILNCWIMLLAHLFESFTFFWYASSFLLGAIIVSLNTHLGSIVGSSFENSTEAYGCNSFSQSYIIFFLLIFESLIKNPDQQIEQRIFIIFYGVFGTASCLIAFTFPFKTKDEGKLNRKIEEMELINSKHQELD